MTRFAPLVLSVAALALAAGCAVPTMPAGLASATSPSGPVRFEVTGSGSAQNVTYGVNGNQSQDAEADLPWSKDVTADGGFSVASLVAQNAGKGKITCKITRDGKVIAEQTSTGQYAVVTCSG